MTAVALFAGAALQNGFVAAGIRWLSVKPSVPGIILSTTVVQGLWWVNIQAVKRTDDPMAGAAWVLGNVAGALLGFYFTQRKWVAQ